MRTGNLLAVTACQFFLLVVLLPQALRAQSVVDQANDLIEQGHYSQAATLLEANSQDCDLSFYTESCWKYFFALGYAYRLAATLDESDDIEVVHIPTILKARKSFRIAVDLTKLLAPSHPKSTQVSDALFLAEIEIQVQNYHEAAKIVDELEGRLRAAGHTLREDEISKIFKRFRIEIGKGLSVSKLLIGNIGPFGFSYIQINPKFELRLVEDSRLSRLRIIYHDINGRQETYLKRSGDGFVFEPLLVLKRKGVFPFDSYVTTIEDIRPPSVSPGVVPLSIEGISLFRGKAEFHPDAIHLTISRHPAFITIFFILWVSGLAALIFINKSIKHMRQSSFQPLNLLSRVGIMLAAVALLFSSLLDYRNIVNPYSLAYGLLVAATIFRMIRRYTTVTKRSNTA